MMVDRLGLRTMTLVAGLVLPAAWGCGPAAEEAAPRQAGSPAATVNATPVEELLQRAIAYHDPEGAWETFSGTLEFEEARPNGEVRNVDVWVDVPTASMVHRGAAGGRAVTREVTPSGCTATVQEREPTPTEVDELNLTCDRLERSRNYYHFLWGLPMKLRDPGTRIDPDVQSTSFQDLDVSQVRVTYDPEVGGDTWYFYFDPETARMVGYRFYHDESQNDGEYITLEGEQRAAGMKIPAIRRWYVNSDDRFLGEDRLIGVRPGDA